MIRQADVRKAFEAWLGNCTCENINHSAKDARGKKTYFFLHPAINEDLKPDLQWLQEAAARFNTVEQLMRHIVGKLIRYRKGYDYGSTPPFICGDCARKAGLEIHEDWGVVTWPQLECSCGVKWDPWDDDHAGAYFIQNGKPTCIECYLKGHTDKDHVKDVKDSLKQNEEAPSRKRRDQIRRERNDQILIDWLSEHTCVECGEDRISELVAVPGPKSPDGKPYQWRRDSGNSSFREKIQTTLVYCKRHQPK